MLMLTVICLEQATSEDADSHKDTISDVIQATFKNLPSERNPISGNRIGLFCVWLYKQREQNVNLFVRY